MSKEKFVMQQHYQTNIIYIIVIKRIIYFVQSITQLRTNHELLMSYIYKLQMTLFPVNHRS